MNIRRVLMNWEGMGWIVLSSKEKLVSDMKITTDISRADNNRFLEPES